MKKILLTSLFLAARAYAHVPYVEGLDFLDDEAFTIQPPIEKSYALYSNFSSATDQDRVIFTLTDADFKDDRVVEDADGRPGRKVSFNTIVPACVPYVQVLPAVALIGPKQNNLAAPLADLQLPFSVTNDQGLYYLNNSEQGAVFKENIAGTRYFQQKKAELIVTVPGIYEIIVWEPRAHTADYVLVVGDEEIFGAADIMQSLKRLRYLRKGEEIKDVNCRQQAKQ